jgi:PKD repeat protein
LTPSAATVIYQWQESTSSTGTYTPISGATSSTYTPVSGDATQYIEVVATGTGGYTGTATSPVAGPVAAAVTTTTATTTTATPTPTTTTALPTVTSVSPSSGTTLGGNVVTIMGSGFSESSTEGDVNQVMFGSTAAPSYTFVSDSEITAPAPAEAVGMVDITVITSGGTSSGTSARSTADEYTYTAATTTTPAVTEITPDYGPVSVATSITIIGTGFTGATGVTVGGTAATNVVVVSSTEITATTPASSTVGQVDVIVTTPSGPSASVTADKYNFATTATSIPVPIFSASPTSGLAPLEVTFTDESTGNPASWDWNFGDGNTSTLENPANTYANNGTYTVTLTEQNSLGTNITTETNYIIVGGSALAADFTATPTSGTVPLTVQFTDTSTGSPTTWLWDFGDGTTGSAQNPSHIYTSPGTYSISLIASNGAGSNTFSQPDTITVSSVTETYTPAPVAVDTFEIPAAKASDSNAAWLAQQNAMSAALAVTATPASSLPPVIPLIALVGVALVFRKKYQ